MHIPETIKNQIENLLKNRTIRWIITFIVIFISIGELTPSFNNIKSLFVDRVEVKSSYVEIHDHAIAKLNFVILNNSDNTLAVTEIDIKLIEFNEHKIKTRKYIEITGKYDFDLKNFNKIGQEESIKLYQSIEPKKCDRIEIVFTNSEARSKDSYKYKISYKLKSIKENIDIGVFIINLN